MKKILLASVLFSGYVQAKVIVEGTASAFFPTNRTMRHIYGVAWQNYGLVFSHIPKLFPKELRPVSLFGQVNYIVAHGYSENGDQYTKIQLVPVTVGVKWTQKVHEKINIYIGAAPRYNFVRIFNDSDYVPPVEKNSNLGGYGVAGVYFYPKKDVVIDIFFAYCHVNFPAPTSTEDYIGFPTKASGMDLGGGIGFNF